MQYYFNFNQFNPKTGKIHKLYYVNCKYIILKAREILIKRKKDELIFAIATINYLLMSSEINYFKEKIIYSDKNNIEDKYKQYIITPALLLNYSRNYFNIENQKEFRNASWTEYFAVLSLALISEINNLVNIKRESNNSDYIYEYAGQLIGDATEAICWAERIEAEKFVKKSPSEQADKIISLKKQRAAIIGHQKEAEFKRKYIDYYLSGTWKTFTECLNSFLMHHRKEVPDTIKNPERVLREALRAYLKENPLLNKNKK